MIVTDSQALHSLYRDLLDLSARLSSLNFQDPDFELKIAALQEHQTSIIASIDSMKSELHLSVLPESVQLMARQCYELERGFREKLLVERSLVQEQLQMLASGRRMRNSYHAGEHYKPDAFFLDKQR